MTNKKETWIISRRMWNELTANKLESTIQIYAPLLLLNCEVEIFDGVRQIMTLWLKEHDFFDEPGWLVNNTVMFKNFYRALKKHQVYTVSFLEFKKVMEKFEEEYSDIINLCRVQVIDLLEISDEWKVSLPLFKELEVRLEVILAKCAGDLIKLGKKYQLSKRRMIYLSRRIFKKIIWGGSYEHKRSNNPRKNESPDSNVKCGAYVGVS